MKFALSDFTLAIDLLLRVEDAKSVTVFQSPLKDTSQRVRATFRHRPKGDLGIDEIIITFGRLNYEEREFLAKCKKVKCSPKKWLITKLFKKK